MGETYTVTERLCKTEDGRIVPEDSIDARWLYATPGNAIPLEEAIANGLVADSQQADGSDTKQGAKPKDKPTGRTRSRARSRRTSRSRARSRRTSRRD